MTMCTHSPERQSYPGLHKKKHGQQVKGCVSSLLCPCETSPVVLHPGLRSAVQERYGPLRVGPAEGHENGQRAGTPLL